MLKNLICKSPEYAVANRNHQNYPSQMMDVSSYSKSVSRQLECFVYVYLNLRTQIKLNIIDNNF